jgi:hypothetical protein
LEVVVLEVGSAAQEELPEEAQVLRDQLGQAAVEAGVQPFYKTLLS